jgi:hypothetical protein
MSFQRQVHVRDHLVLLHVRRDVDIVEEDREVSQGLAAPGKPDLVQVDRSAIVRA